MNAKEYSHKVDDPAVDSQLDHLADWAESAEISPGARIVKSSEPESGMDLLAAALGSESAVRRAVGKPSLSGHGVSPARSVRLSVEMDERLIKMAEQANVKPSEIIRRALGEYMSRANSQWQANV